MKHKKRVLMVGGGSGGHVTPILAVVNELIKLKPDVEIRFWCDRAYLKRATNLLEHSGVPIKIQTIRAGKLRRYHNTSLWRQLLDFKTLTHNLIDAFIVAIGFMQSFVRLILWRPNVIFCKGGFVCLPVGFVASFLRIPFIIHDSDAHPGLTSRLLAPRAKMVATGAPVENYPYPAEKTRYVGIPIQTIPRIVGDEERRSLKQILKLPANEPLVVITGGGLGAKRINDAVVKIAPDLLKRTSIIHLSGSYQHQELMNKIPLDPRYKLIEFVGNISHMERILAAADVVITRAGATSLAELAAVGAAVIIIPNDQLTGGHQTKNAQVFVDAGAAISLDESLIESKPEELYYKTVSLVEDTNRRRELSNRIFEFAKPDAAKDVAEMIVASGEL